MTGACHCNGGFKTCNCTFQATAKRTFAAQAVAKTERELIKAEPLKVSTLSNGLTIASLENYSPVTTIGVAVKAGARNEGYDNAGVTHALRVASGMATSKNTAFGMCRNLQQVSYHIKTLSELLMTVLP